MSPAPRHSSLPLPGARYFAACIRIGNVCPFTAWWRSAPRFGHQTGLLAPHTQERGINLQDRQLRFRPLGVRRVRVAAVLRRSAFARRQGSPRPRHPFSAGDVGGVCATIPPNSGGSARQGRSDSGKTISHHATAKRTSSGAKSDEGSAARPPGRTALLFQVGSRGFPRQGNPPDGGWLLGTIAAGRPLTRLNPPRALAR